MRAVPGKYVTKRLTKRFCRFIKRLVKRLLKTFGANVWCRLLGPRGPLCILDTSWYIMDGQ